MPCALISQVLASFASYIRFIISLTGLKAVCELRMCDFGYFHSQINGFYKVAVEGVLQLKKKKKKIWSLDAKYETEYDTKYES